MAIVLLHGLGSRPQAWAPVVAALDGDVLALALPGHAGAPDLDGPHTVPAYVDAVACDLAAAGLERPDVAGNSLGGAIALELGRRGLVRRAVALSPAGFASPAEARYAVAYLRGMRAAAELIGARPGVLRRPRSRAAVLGAVAARPGRLGAREAWEGIEGLLAAEAFRPTLAHLRRYAFPAGWSGAGATVAWGRRDVLLPPWQARRARARLPEARHVSLPGCGHVPMADDPERIAALIRS